MILCEKENSKTYNNIVFSYDDVLDGLDFETLIMEVHQNFHKEDITKESFLKQFKKDLEIRLQDAYFLIDICSENLVKAAKGEI